MADEKVLGSFRSGSKFGSHKRNKENGPFTRNTKQPLNWLNDTIRFPAPTEPVLASPSKPQQNRIAVQTANISILIKYLWIHIIIMIIVMSDTDGTMVSCFTTACVYRWRTRRAARFNCSNIFQPVDYNYMPVLGSFSFKSQKTIFRFMFSSSHFFLLLFFGFWMGCRLLDDAIKI